MPRNTKTPDERLADLQAKKDQLENRIKRERAKVQSAERKKDTRRKVIAGALALEHAGKDSVFSETLNRLLSQFVTRPQDRELFELPPK